MRGRRLFNLPSHENLQLTALHVARSTAPVRCIPQGVQAHIKIDRYAASCCSHSSCPAKLQSKVVAVNVAVVAAGSALSFVACSRLDARSHSSQSSHVEHVQHVRPGQARPGQQERSMFTMSSPGRSRPGWGSIFKAARYAHRKSNKCFCSFLFSLPPRDGFNCGSGCIVIAQLIDKLQISLHS